MSEFINTIDSLGDDVVLGKILDGSITEFKDNVVTKIYQYVFFKRTALEIVDLPNVTSVGAEAFQECSNLTTVILRSNTLCSLSSTSSFGSTPISNGTGYIYVPRALIDSYKSAWSTYANQFRVLEDYTIDGTTTGALDENKVNPTQTRALLNGSITEVESDVMKVNESAFRRCYKLSRVDLKHATNINSVSFGHCYTLTTVILRSESVCALENTDAFDNCFHILGKVNSNYNPNGDKDGFIYVNDNLVEEYKNATNWSVYASQIKPISELGGSL